jgi:signal transduction histidine kinase
MGTMTRLLDKSLKIFTLYALIILILSIPVYVLVIDYIWISELDENNWLTLQHTKQKLQSKRFTTEEIEKINQIWGALQPGVSIVKAESKHAFQDSTYEVIRPNEYDQDDGEDRFRGLKSWVLLNETPYLVTIETNLEESDETFAAVAAVTLFFFMVLVLGFILLNRKVASKTWRPFDQTLSSLKSFELSKDSSIDLPESDIQEFQELNHVLLYLIKNNVNAYQQQKSFTENASHELQTPIALLKSKMDLLIQQKNISPQISEIISSIEAPLSRLSRINKNLLLLAKVEHRQYNDIEKLDLKEYLENTIVLFEDYINNKKLDLSNDVVDSIKISANSFLAETLVHNLLSNAIRHTPSNGQIKIINHESSLRVMNTGKEALDQSRLFERFATTNKNKVSSGLGLSIIREITNKYGWQVGYNFENGYHVFVVTF